jgi:hypothetical protein
MKRQANPHLSASGELALAQYAQALCEQEEYLPTLAADAEFVRPSARAKQAVETMCGHEERDWIYRSSIACHEPLYLKA